MSEIDPSAQVSHSQDGRTLTGSILSLPGTWFDKISPEPMGGCWIWTATRTGKDLYGQAWLKGKRGLAHRMVYELMVGEIPEGLQLDHLCKVTLCVNPDHLEPVTSRENTRRSSNVVGQNMQKTHCVRGHILSPENVFIWTDKIGSSHRHCRACSFESDTRRRHANSEAINARRRASYPAQRESLNARKRAARAARKVSQ